MVRLQYKVLTLEEGDCLFFSAITDGGFFQYAR